MRLPQTRSASFGRGAGALTISGTYAAVVLAVAVFVWTASDATGLAGVWLVLVTLPSSVLVQFVPAEGDWFIMLLTLGGLVQAWLLWIGLRGRRLA